MELPGGARQPDRLVERALCAIGLMTAFLLYGVLQGVQSAAIAAIQSVPVNKCCCIQDSDYGFDVDRCGLIRLERIMKMPYGDDEERFPYSAFLVFNNRVVACLVAVAILAYKVWLYSTTVVIVHYACRHAGGQ
jgi:hypothetical protein